MECARCGSTVASNRCWWCGAAICGSCEIDLGHCGHPEADTINRVTAEAKGWEERDHILRKALAHREN